MDDHYFDQPFITLPTSDDKIGEDDHPSFGVIRPERFEDVPLHSVVDLSAILSPLDGRVVDLSHLLPLPSSPRQ